jgi:glycosyltransferase involved in cell wall biosynthesis
VKAEPIRIGYVIGQLTYGGAERQLYELICGIDRTRFQCFVYCLSERTAPYGDKIRAAGAELRILKRKGHLDASRILKLASLLRKDRIVILHSFLFHGNGYAWPARLLARVPHLLTSARNCKDVGLLRGWVNRLAFNGSDAIVCNGEAVRSFVVEHYRAELEKSVVIYNGLDLNRFSVLPAAGGGKIAGRTAEEKLVITVGRLVPQKDLDLFLEAAALLTRKKAGVRFLIVGDGPCRERLERKASQNGLRGKIVFLGERDDIPELLQAADIFWLTSSWEGLPNVLLEAMACAKPIVTRDVGACREIINHGENGYLVPDRNAESFAQHTLGLLSDLDKAREMGRAGRKLAEEKFSSGKMVRATESLYASLLDSRPGSPRRLCEN